MLTADNLKNVLIYDPETGLFEWLLKPSVGVNIGDVAGAITSEGYVTISYRRKAYRAHRLAWPYVYGEYPKNLIDHINGVRADNRIANLRPATNSQNLMNSKVRRESKTGIKGVSERNWPGRRFCAAIVIGGSRRHLGVFHTASEASNAYRQAARDHFGEYARLTC